MKKAKVIHYFDVEDVFFGNSHDFHGIPKWIAEILTEEGVIGTFNITGTKIKALVKDQRRDVIEALRKHELGNHTYNGSFQPAMPEYLNGLSWLEGVQEVENIDGRCFDLIKEVFGKEASHFHEHFDCISPQAYTSFLKRKKALSGVIASVKNNFPDHGVSWYCNNLSFSINNSVNFPRNYYSEDWEQNSSSWAKNAADQAEKIDFFSVFGAHPFEIYSTVFTDCFCSVNGRNLAPDKFGLWGSPAVRGKKEIELAKKNYRKAVQMLSRHESLEVTSFRELLKIYGHQKKYITREDLEPFCVNVVDNWQVPMGRYFSAAELLVALCQTIIEYSKSGKIQERIQRPSILGPVKIPVGWPEIPELSFDLAVKLAEDLIKYVSRYNHIPHSIIDEEQEIGPSHLLRALCSFYLDMIIRQQPKPVKLWEPLMGSQSKVMPVWPKSDDGPWRTHFLRSPDFNYFDLTKFYRLMNWTLKPADTLDHFKNNNIECESNLFIPSQH